MKLSPAILFVLSAIVLPVTINAQQQADTLLALLIQYQSARQKIEADAVSAYSNALATVGTQLKQKGDVDAYLLLDAEKKRLALEGTIDVATTNATPPIADVAKSAVAGRNTKTAVLLRKHIDGLDKLVKQLMVADKIDEAKTAKEEKDKATALLAELESNVPKTAVQGDKSKVKMVGGYPSISGVWKESNDIYVWIQQDKENWTAKCGYYRADVGIVNWEMKGKITKEGRMEGRLICTRAPQGWKNQTRTFKLSEDGRLLGQASIDGGGRHGLDYSRMPDLTKQGVPKGTSIPPIVGIWRKSDGLFMVCYGDGATGSPESKSTDGSKWRKARQPSQLAKGKGSAKLGSQPWFRMFEFVDGSDKVNGTVTVSADGKSLTGQGYTAEKCVFDE